MGGQVGAGESIEATLERETMEEAGLAIADAARPAAARRRRAPAVAEGDMDERIDVFRRWCRTGSRRSTATARSSASSASMPTLIERLAAGAFTLEATLILGAELERCGAAAAVRRPIRPSPRVRRHERVAQRRQQASGASRHQRVAGAEHDGRAPRSALRDRALCFVSVIWSRSPSDQRRRAGDRAAASRPPR